jgi:hypothetical protein
VALFDDNRILFCLLDITALEGSRDFLFPLLLCCGSFSVELTKYLGKTKEHLFWLIFSSVVLEFELCLMLARQAFYELSRSASPFL